MIPLLHVSCLLFSTEKQTVPDYILNKETNKQIIKQIKDERILFNFPIFSHMGLKICREFWNVTRNKCYTECVYQAERSNGAEREVMSHRVYA